MWSSIVLIFLGTDLTYQYRALNLQKGAIWENGAAPLRSGNCAASHAHTFAIELFFDF